MNRDENLGVSPGRGALLLLALLIGAAALPPARAGAPADSASAAIRQRIRDLTKLVKRPDAPDSLRYQLALAYGAAGTIEDRYQALETFYGIRRSYEHDTGYFRDEARIFEESQQPYRARLCLERVVELDSTDVEAHVEIARLQLKELLYDFDLNHAGAMLRTLKTALEVDPDHRDALFLSSLACELAGGLPAVANPVLVEKGIACCRRILDRDPADMEARLLLAAEDLDLGRDDDSEAEFTAALRTAPDDLRATLASSKWTAPRNLVKRTSDMADSERVTIDRAYWRYYDPTPLTLVNENQLETWRRLVLADLLFGDRKKGLRGWDTAPGEAFVRYGSPRLQLFDPGTVVGDAPTDATLSRASMSRAAAMSKAPIRFEPPAWGWRYSFRGFDFDLKFEDKSLNGTFLPDNRTAQAMTELRRTVPVIFHDAPPGLVRHLYMTASGLAGPESKVEEKIELGVPLWKRSPDADWLGKVHVEVLLRDSTRATVRRTLQHVEMDDVYPMLNDSLDVMLLTNEFELKPGRYTVTAFVDGDKDRHGVFTYPFEVRDYKRTPGLTISDLDLALSTEPDARGPQVKRLGRSYVPNPLCLAGDERNLDVLYEIYGLADDNGISRHQARYTVLPRGYVLAYESAARAGTVGADNLVEYAAAEMAAGGGSLDTHNFMDVYFPTAEMRIQAGRAPKGTRVVLKDLDPGEYAFIVTIKDEISAATAYARTFFRILTPEQRRELVAYGAEEP